MAGDEDYEIPDSGAIYTFGRSRFADNQPSHFFIRNDPFVDIACGDEYTALVCRNGRVFVLGHNEYGQLGLGHTKTMTKPSCVKLLKPYHCSRVACGKAHTVVITTCNTVLTFGCNADGQLGLGDLTDQTTPHVVSFAELDGQVVTVAAGSVHSAALTDSGVVYMWGANSDGQCGLETDEHLLTPTRLDLSGSVQIISCGYYHSAFISDGVVYTFGEGDSGKLGISGELKSFSTPQQVTLEDAAILVKCGGNHTLVLTELGQVVVFGSNFSGQLGLNVGDLECTVPSPLHFPTKIVDLSAGESHSAFIAQDGRLYTCGDGRHGKLCNEQEVSNVTEPTLVTAFYNHWCVRVSCGGCHTMVLAKLRFHELDPDIICSQPKTTLPPLKTKKNDAVEDDKVINDTNDKVMNNTNGNGNAEEHNEFEEGTKDTEDEVEDNKSNTESNFHHEEGEDEIEDVHSVKSQVDDIYSEIAETRSEEAVVVTPEGEAEEKELDLVVEKRNRIRRIFAVFRRNKPASGVLVSHLNSRRNSPSSAVTEKVEDKTRADIGNQETSKACTIL